MDEMTLLRAIRKDVREPTLEELALIRETIVSSIDTRHRIPRRRALRRAGWTGLGVAIAGGVAVAVVATNVFGLGGYSGGAAPAAAAALHKVAVATIHSSDPVVAPGQYLKVATTMVGGVDSVDASGHSVPYLSKGTETLYIPEDRTGVWALVAPLSKPYKTFGPESVKVAEQDYQSELKVSPDGDGILHAQGGAFRGVEPTVTPETLAATPRDPQKLLAYIHQETIGQGSSPDDSVLVYIGDTLACGIVPADLRAAFYETLALVPGVEITDNNATLDGRTGIAFGRIDTHLNVRNEIIVDPASGLLIGHAIVILPNTKWLGGFPVNTTVEWSAVATSVVDSAP